MPDIIHIDMVISSSTPQIPEKNLGLAHGLETFIIGGIH